MFGDPCEVFGAGSDYLEMLPYRRTTVRNLRIREDTAKVSQSIIVHPAFDLTSTTATFT